MKEYVEILKTKDKMLDDKNEEIETLKDIINGKEDEISQIKENKNEFRD